MNLIKKGIGKMAMLAVSFLAGCNDSTTTTAEKDADTSVITSTSKASTMPAYDPAKDPVLIGGAAIKKLSDSLNIKMYEFTVKPGESWSLHDHPDHTVYVLEGGKISLYIAGSGTQEMDLPTGMGFVSGGISDSGRNISKNTIRMLVQDIYRPRGE
ncbi:cupin domain-containing protein [Flavihumibacter sp. ZG627]|uniref:cupin domain-containing protein n=1 Tax=Flavihumibacter sp. ZG627 TaxID=1463156 RepID=UPI00057CA18E|nr:hypothetical protein [Flavihumibacter sp. ZG627]KIC89635.1 hypothetical protein HY58_16115 [Flavihumibacter sp. ZG627]